MEDAPEAREPAEGRHDGWGNRDGKEMILQMESAMGNEAISKIEDAWEYLVFYIWLNSPVYMWYMAGFQSSRLHLRRHIKNRITFLHI